MSQFIPASRVGRTAAAMAAVAGAMALGACGGGGGDSETIVVPPQPGPAQAVPGTAQVSVAGLVTYLQALTAIQDDTLLPLDVSTITLPTDDQAPPTPL